MKHFLFLIQFAMLISIVINSCTSPNTNDKEKDVHKVTCKSLYNYYDYPHSNHDDHIYNDDNGVCDDTLLVGLLSISKETCIYKDGTSDYSLRLRIIDPNLRNGSVKMRTVTLKEDKLGKIEEFLDSCISGSNLSDNEERIITIDDDTYFSYDSGEKNLDVCFLSESRGLDLLITLEKLKEIVEKAKKE